MKPEPHPNTILQKTFEQWRWGSLMCISYNESHVCDVALSPTRAKGHVAERRAAAPRSPSRPKGGDAHTSCYAKFQGVMSYPLYNLNGKTSDISLKWASSVNSTKLFWITFCMMIRSAIPTL